MTATIERHAPSVVDVTLHDAKTGKAETLICTPEHPLYVQGQGWVEAGSLGIGTSIVSRAGPALQVTDLTWEKNKAQELAAGSASASFGGYTVYNLTVEDDHTFFVGTANGGTWVHNDCHHSIPKFLGGNPRQPLITISRAAHVDYHRLLDQLLRANGMLGGRGGKGNGAADWDAYMAANPGAQQRAFNAVQAAARSIDAQHGTSIEQHFLQNVANGEYFRHP